jgi:hypothetical protein
MYLPAQPSVCNYTDTHLYVFIKVISNQRCEPCYTRATAYRTPQHCALLAGHFFFFGHGILTTLLFVDGGGCEECGEEEECCCPV